jgi:hypothetical protein
MHRTVFALGILFILIGLALVFIGALASIFILSGLISVGAGFDLIIGGAVVALVGYFI